MQVDHVECFVSHRSNDPELRRRIRSHRGNRSVGRRRQAQAERRHTSVRGRPVTRCEHPHRVGAPPQRPRQRQHLGLHPAGHRQAVRTDQPDTHQSSRRCSGTLKPNAR